MRKLASNVSVVVFDLGNQNKSKEFNLDKFDEWNDLAAAVRPFDDYDLSVTKQPFEPIGGPDLRTLFGVSKLLRDHHNPKAIALVQSYDPNWFSKAVETNYDALSEQVGTVRHAKDKEDFVLEYFDELGMDVPKWLQGYIDTEAYFRDNFDINLDGSWSEDADGIYVYENTR